MSHPTRRQVREAFASLLAANDVGEGKPVRAVYAHRVGDFAGQTPVRALGSGGTESQPLTTRGTRRVYLIDVFTFVLYALVDDAENLVLDAQLQPVWDEQDAEDTLDALDDRLQQLLSGLRANEPYWKSVSVAGASQTEVVTLGGLAYYLEVTPLRFELF